jgi:hypothetical protein
MSASDYRDESTTDVGDHLSIPELVAVYVQAEREIRASFATVHGALERLTATMSGTLGFHLQGRHNHHGMDWADPDDSIAHLRRQVWRKLIERSQIQKAMSIAAWKKLTEQVDREDPPEITSENVEGMIEGFRHDMPAMLEAAVHEVFDWLRRLCPRIAPRP